MKATCSSVPSFTEALSLRVIGMHAQWHCPPNLACDLGLGLSLCSALENHTFDINNSAEGTVYISSGFMYTARLRNSEVYSSST
jgi:hypothetical protein